ncbi:hypothetical protein FNV43_RR00483 [Rhamnella rubrinervis]|uniref:Aminoacyl-tRNA synthetase class Ia domain-containing protein n=1 Tax=Rhamnella rubrinervis TaxID=2594499 RepID=A0A8K0MR75_9ROSA|nr:hypothetical protein FNV43_RR00483 [Rhamnella rubrinervis]
MASRPHSLVFSFSIVGLEENSDGGLVVKMIALGRYGALQEHVFAFQASLSCLTCNRMVTTWKSHAIEQHMQIKPMFRRLWFYTLMVLFATLFVKPAFRNLICNGLVLAEDGRKMSKNFLLSVSLGRTASLKLLMRYPL